MTGDQTIGGTKTFSGSTIHSLDVIRKSSTITRGTVPTSNQYASWLIRDKNNAQIANFYVTQTTDNDIQASMIATNLNSSDTAYDAAIRVVAKRDGTVYTYAPTPATSDSSSKIATTANVDAKITAQAVKLSGNQTIAGIKTFSNPVYCINNQAYFHKMPDYTNGTTPSTNYYLNTMTLNDSTGNYFGFYGPEMLTDGSYSVRMGVRSQVDNTKYSILKVGCLSDGTFYTSAPTPATSDNSTKIATTAFVNNKFQVVTALPANPTPGVFYFVKES